MGGQHNANAKNGYKYLVNGDCRRELVRNVINEEIKLRSFSKQQVMTSNYKISVPFSIPLSEDLPPSFVYYGEMMSHIAIEYRLTAMFVGQRSKPLQWKPGMPAKSGGFNQAHGLPSNAQLIVQASEYLTVRELDPPHQIPITVSQEGKVTGGLGLMSKGKTNIEGQLLTPRVCQNAEAMVKISIDNSNCSKMVDNIKFCLRRTITAKGRDSQMNKKEFKDT